MSLPRFDSVDHMLSVHQSMFGEAGRALAEIVIEWAPKLFAVPLNPLALRVVLAPQEMGPYNRRTAYAYTEGGMILVNRHRCGLDGETGISVNDLVVSRDTIAHELTHFRQAQLIREHEYRQDLSRGCHRDKGWWQAIGEAAPHYLGVSFPPERWPKLKSVRHGKTVTKEIDLGRLTEVEATHWPHSFRPLITAKDPRLPRFD